VYRQEREKVSKYKACQVRGTLTPEVKQPFLGSCNTHDRYKQPEVTERPEYVLPYSMLMVPHSLKMPLRTTNQLHLGPKQAKKHTE
jgi:hypothetical protein